MTTTPRPPSSEGVAMYPRPVAPLPGNSTISPLAAKATRGLLSTRMSKELGNDRARGGGQAGVGVDQAVGADDGVDERGGHDFLAPVPRLVPPIVEPGGERVPE